MTIRTLTASLAAVALVALAVSLVFSGCSSDGSDPSNTTVPGSTTATSITGSTVSTAGTTTTATLPPQISDWDRELRDNSLTQHDLASYLSGIGAPDDDPLMAVYYGLQARTRAITCRKALDAGNLQLADSSMLEVYYAMNLGRAVAEGEVAEALAAARALIDTIGAPSGAPAEAAAALDRFIEATAALRDQATEILSSTTTT